MLAVGRGDEERKKGGGGDGGRRERGHCRSRPEPPPLSRFLCVVLFAISSHASQAPIILHGQTETLRSAPPRLPLDLL